MARFTSGGLTTAGSTTLPIASVYSGASEGFALREVGITNTTDTSFAVKLVRISTRESPGTGLTEAEWDPAQGVATTVSAFLTHTGTNPTLGDDLGYRAQIGAAKGAGVIWTFGDIGIRCSSGTQQGIGIVVENGTGQAAQVYFTYDT